MDKEPYFVVLRLNVEIVVQGSSTFTLFGHSGWAFLNFVRLVVVVVVVVVVVGVGGGGGPQGILQRTTRDHKTTWRVQ